MRLAARQQRFAIMVSAFGRPLYRYAFWLCGDTVRAQDLVQECLLRAWRSFDGLRDERAVKSWLFAILRREFLRGVARNGSIVDEALPDDLVDGAANLDFIPDMMAMRQALRSLPSHYREPLLLQAVEGFTLEEIAELLGLPVNTVTTRVFRARLRLRAILSPEPVAIATGGRR